MANRLTIAQCRHCGTEFTLYPKIYYCSDGCRARYIRNKWAKKYGETKACGLEAEKDSKYRIKTPHKTYYAMTDTRLKKVEETLKGLQIPYEVELINA